MNEMEWRMANGSANGMAFEWSAFEFEWQMDGVVEKARAAHCIL
jgi:hypothetical protein